MSLSHTFTHNYLTDSVYKAANQQTVQLRFSLFCQTNHQEDAKCKGVRHTAQGQGFKELFHSNQQIINLHKINLQYHG